MTLRMAAGPATMTTIAGLASGEGANLLHIHERKPGGADLAVVLSDDPTAPIQARAGARDIDTVVVQELQPTGSPEGERRLLQALEGYDIDLVAVDGYSPTLTETFLDAVPLTMAVHPSLLPAFPGPNPVQRSLDAGVSVTGCTVHVVLDEDTAAETEDAIPPDAGNATAADTGGATAAAAFGPIITQEPVPVFADDEHESLEDRVETEAEFRAFPRAIRWFAAGRLSVSEAGVTVEGDRANQFPLRRTISEDREKTLRYGENPHQQAASYIDPTATGPNVIQAAQLNDGAKGLSYNNYNDAAAALDLIQEFEEPAAAVIKHTNPAGCAIASSVAEAYERALATDAKSAFGGIVALNRTCDGSAAERIVESFKEAVVAPGYTEDALGIFNQTEDLRVLDVGALGDRSHEPVEKQVAGGRLVQEPDRFAPGPADLEIVTDRAPTDEERETMAFAWRTIKHVKSNAIVFATGTETVGIGMGQVSRVDAVTLAAMKAQRDAEGKSAAGAVMASDAFFPFRDGIDEAAEAGIEAVVQPGGSVNDEEVIEAADDHGMAMAFTGSRCFRHD